MILVLDVGNTNIKCGLFQGTHLMHSFRISTNIETTSDEYGIRMLSFFDYLGLRVDMVEGIIVSSVIPSVNYTIEHMSRQYFGKLPLMVGPGIKTGINIKYENPKELGADRIVNAVAAYEKFGGPVITIDFGTATSFGAISEEGDFLGGAICPGLKISTEALTSNAAKLPRVELHFPSTAICRSTTSGMQAGILYGYVGQVERLVRMMENELGGGATVVATGGFAPLIASQTRLIDHIEPALTLMGLNLIYLKNNR